MLHLKQWHYSLHRDFQNCYSIRRSPTGFFSSNSTRYPYTYIIHRSREFSIQNPILHAEDKELFECYYYIQRAKRPSFQKRNSMHRRQGDLLEVHPCVLQDLPKTFQAFQPQDLPRAFQTFQTFQSFMTFQAFPGISTSSSTSRVSTPLQHSPIRMHILHILQFDWFPQETPLSTSWDTTNITTNFHSSKKGRCCDMGHVGDVGDIADMPKGRNATFVGDRHYQDVKLTFTSN